MVTLKKTIEEYEDRKILTAKEKKLILEAYEKCKELKLKNFINEVIVEKVREKNDEIPEVLIIEYAEELEAKEIK